jgi:hypothetical protein
MMKGQECPEQVNPTRVLSYDNFNWEVYEGLSDYMKDKIKSSDEFKKLQEPANIIAQGDNGSEVNEDGLPF